MEEELKSEIIFRIYENLKRVEQCLVLLSEIQIWEKPNANTNSVGNLILHLQGNVSQYILSSLGNQVNNRNRDGEFDDKQRIDSDKLLANFKYTLVNSISIIQELSIDELQKKRKVQGFKLSGIGIIIHVVEHLSYHVGQISFQTKLLTNIDLGYYKGINLNITD